MEEILASIRRIISDDDATKPAAAKAMPEPAPPAPAAKNGQDDIDAMLAGFDATHDEGPKDAPPAEAAARSGADVLELTESMQARAPAFGALDGPPDVVFSEPPATEPPPR